MGDLAGNDHVIDAATRARLDRDGFAVIDRLVDDDAVALLRTAYDEIIDGTVAAPGDRWLGGITRQVKAPSFVHPTFARNPALDAVLAIGDAVFGQRAAVAFDMLIAKGPGHPHATPWHQDIGYFRSPVAPAGTAPFFDDLQVWIALDDVDEDTGCMCFVPGRHRDPSLEHEVVSGDPHSDERLIGIVEPERMLDLGAAVCCPLTAGGATVHLPGTPHFTGPNRSTDRQRRAYIVNVAPAPMADVIDGLERSRWLGGAEGMRAAASR